MAFIPNIPILRARYRRSIGADGRQTQAPRGVVDEKLVCAHPCGHDPIVNGWAWGVITPYGKVIMYLDIGETQ